MIHVTMMDSHTDTPYSYLTRDYANVLRQLLELVPEAKKKFDEGSIPAAITLLNAANHVRLNPSVGMTKQIFLARIALDMPNKYSA